MKHLIKFNEMENYSLTIKDDNTISPGFDKTTDVKNTIYNKEWEKFLPETMSINYQGKKFKFKKGNIMINADMVQISYDSYGGEIWGSPDTLEFDVYFAKGEDGKIRITVDITYGDAMCSEFSVKSPNIVNVIEDTTYRSKFDQSNTVFALEDDSLNRFIEFLNKFEGMKLNRDNFKFLDKYDNWKN